MDEKPIDSIPTTSDASKPAPKKRSLLTSLLAVVICCGAFFWAYQTIRDELKPNSDIARLLRSNDVAEREDGARRLGVVAPENLPSAVALLVSAQSDPDPKVRETASWSLGSTVVATIKLENKDLGRQTMQALVRGLSDENGDVRASAAESLTQIAKFATPETFPAEVDPIVKEVVGLLNDSSERARRAGRITLTTFAGSMKIDPPAALLEELVNAKLADSRVQAALALGAFKTKVEPTVKALALALKDSDPAVRSNAATALRAFNTAAAPAIVDLVAVLDDPYVPPTPPPAPPLPPGVIRPQAKAPGGGGNGPAVTDPAAEATRTIAPLLEAQIAKGEAPPAEVFPKLLKSLKSSRPALRDAAGDAFLRLRKAASAITPELIQELSASIPNTEPGFGPIAATTLGSVGPNSPMANEAIAALVAALDAKAAETRAKAVEALGRFGKEAVSAKNRLKEVGEADKDLTEAVKVAIDRIDEKIPPYTPRRRGQGRPGGGAGIRKGG